MNIEEVAQIVFKHGKDASIKSDVAADKISKDLEEEYTTSVKITSFVTANIAEQIKKYRNGQSLELTTQNIIGNTYCSTNDRFELSDFDLSFKNGMNNRTGYVNSNAHSISTTPPNQQNNSGNIKISSLSTSITLAEYYSPGMILNGYDIPHSKMHYFIACDGRWLDVLKYDILYKSINKTILVKTRQSSNNPSIIEFELMNFPGKYILTKWYNETQQLLWNPLPDVGEIFFSLDCNINDPTLYPCDGTLVYEDDYPDLYKDLKYLKTNITLPTDYCKYRTNPISSTLPSEYNYTFMEDTDPVNGKVRFQLPDFPDHYIQALP